MLKRSSILVLSIITGSLLYGCQTPPPESKNAANTNTAATAYKPVDPKIIDEVKEMLTTHDKALNDQNLDAVMAAYSANPKTVLLGTGKGERFVGTEAIRNAYTEIFKDYDKGTFTSKCDPKSGDVDAAGTMGWIAATCESSDSMKGVKREYVLNVSAVLVKENGGWKFVLVHMSNDTTVATNPTDAKKPEVTKPQSDKPEPGKAETNK